MDGLQTFTTKSGASVGYLPEIGFMIKIPQMLIDGRAFQRGHNRVAKRAGRLMMMRHHRKVVPKHFERFAREKYDHDRRGDHYRETKKRVFRSITDLVKKGRTKRTFTHFLPRIQIGGTAQTVLRCRSFYRWPFPVATDKWKASRVKVEQMAKELATFTPEEALDAAEFFRDTYLQELSAEIDRSPKLRRRIGNINQA